MVNTKKTLSSLSPSSTKPPSTGSRRAPKISVFDIFSSMSVEDQKVLTLEVMDYCIKEKRQDDADSPIAVAVEKKTGQFNILAVRRLYKYDDNGEVVDVVIFPVLTDIPKFVLQKALMEKVGGETKGVATDEVLLVMHSYLLNMGRISPKSIAEVTTCYSTGYLYSMRSPDGVKQNKLVEGEAADLYTTAVHYDHDQQTIFIKDALKRPEFEDITTPAAIEISNDIDSLFHAIFEPYSREQRFLAHDIKETLAMYIFQDKRGVSVPAIFISGERGTGKGLLTEFFAAPYGKSWVSRSPQNLAEKFNEQGLAPCQIVDEMETSNLLEGHKIDNLLKALQSRTNRSATVRPMGVSEKTIKGVDPALVILTANIGAFVKLHDTSLDRKSLGYILGMLNIEGSLTSSPAYKSLLHKYGRFHTMMEKGFTTWALRELLPLYKDTVLPRLQDADNPPPRFQVKLHLSAVAESTYKESETMTIWEDFLVKINLILSEADTKFYTDYEKLVIYTHAALSIIETAYGHGRIIKSDFDVVMDYSATGHRVYDKGWAWKKLQFKNEFICPSNHFSSTKNPVSFSNNSMNLQIEGRNKPKMRHFGLTQRGLGGLYASLDIDSLKMCLGALGQRVANAEMFLNNVSQTTIKYAEVGKQ